MGWGFWALAGALLATALLAATLAMRLRAQRKRARRELDALLSERDELEAKVAELTRKARARQSTESPTDGPDYVITRLGSRDLEPGAGDERADRSGRRVPDQMVLSAVFGEPLVKALSFGHGVRRALSPESRNRIGFEMRRETRRSRKVRRREMRQAWKQMRAERTDGREDVA